MWGGVLVWCEKVFGFVFGLRFFWCRICLCGEKQIASKTENTTVVVYLYLAWQKQVVPCAGIVVTLGQVYSEHNLSCSGEHLNSWQNS